jgi:hypothetical protein
MEARESFLDVRGKLRPDVKRLRGLLPTVSDAAVAAVCEAVVGYQLGRWSGATYPRVLAAAGLSPEQLHPLFSGLLAVCRAAARSRLKAPLLAADMQADLKMAPAAAAAAAALFVRLQQGGSGGAREALPSVSGVAWRVEVTVSSSSVSRVFQPVLLLQLTGSDGSTLLMECSRERFQQLRFQAASALKSCEDTAALPILKIE